MRPDLFDMRQRTPSLRVSLAAGLLAFACLAALLLGGATAGATIADREARLAEVRDEQAAVGAEIATHNDEINALIASVSEMRQREEAVAAELDAAEADLDAAETELGAGREHLREVRAELEDAITELERVLVGIYKSESPDMVGLMLESAGWEDASVDAAYMNRVQDYQASTVTRVRELRAEAEVEVDRLAAARDSIAATRDSIAARRDQLAAERSELEAREAELASARASRRQSLSALAGRESELERGIEQAEARHAQAQRQAQMPPPAPEPEVDAERVAAPPVSAPAPSGSTATLNSDGTATAPADAPPEVVAAIASANAISDTPYVWGGGHGSFEDSGYDCSGAVSYALNGGGFLSSPLDSTGLSYWGESGEGSWITVYANSGHTYVVIAGLRFDTSGGAGPRWHADGGSPAGFVARHPAGF